MLREIKLDLAENYRGDEEVLEHLIDEITAEALFISNREATQINKDILKYEIKNCVKAVYLQRGIEDVSGLSQGGVNSSYKDAIEEMRHNIIRNGKRILK